MNRLQRFLRKTRLERDGCLIWTGGISSGYPKFWDGSKVVLAHRFSYLSLVGQIPEGQQLDHICNTPACVRWDHVRPVTPRENVLRGDTAAARNAAKTACPQGHAYHVRGDGWRTCLTCNRERDRLRYPTRPPRPSRAKTPTIKESA